MEPQPHVDEPSKCLAGVLKKPATKCVVVPCLVFGGSKQSLVRFVVSRVVKNPSPGLHLGSSRCKGSDGPARGSPKLVLLLKNENGRAVLTRTYAGRQASATTANDDDVVTIGHG